MRHHPLNQALQHCFCNQIVLNRAQHLLNVFVGAGVGLQALREASQNLDFLGWEHSVNVVLQAVQHIHRRVAKDALELDV